MLSSLRRIKFGIVNPRTIHNHRPIKADNRLSFYPVVGLRQVKTGAIVLNKPDNNNIVTEECADELFRFLSTYHHDHSVENLWIESRGGTFSGGADYGELASNSHYLDKLMRLAIKVGEFNKPIFAQVSGGVRGLSAYLLTMFSTSMGTPNSSLRLDETARGFIPIFGGSHKLSRLVGNLGLYLALTGDKIDGSEMARLGFLRAMIRDELPNNVIRRHLSDANLWNVHYQPPSSHGSSQPRKQSEVAFKINYFYDLMQETQKQLFKTQGNANSRLALHQYRIAQTEYYNIINPYNSFTDKGLHVNNYYEMRHDRAFAYLKEKDIVEEANVQSGTLPRVPIYKLLRVFNKNSISQVMQELKQDGSEWARNTEASIRAKDPLAVHLTFHLLKNARSLSWVEALEAEYTLARRILDVSKVQESDIDNGKGSTKIFKNPYSHLRLEEIGEEVVSQFFRPVQSESEIFDHDTPNHSLLPTSEFWRAIPDAGRNYLNRTFFDDYHAKFGQFEVRRFLNEHQIDYRDKSYNLPVLREYFYKNLDYQRLIEGEIKRLRSIFLSQTAYRELRDSRNQYVKQFAAKPEFERLIAEEIKAYFNEKFDKRFDDFVETAKIAGKESRMSIIRNYIKTLTENVVLRGHEIEEGIKKGNVRHMGILRLDDPTDVFHAETDYEKKQKQLQVLKEAIKTGDASVLEQIDPNIALKDNMFTQEVPNEEQISIIEKDKHLRLNYNRSILNRESTWKYKHLIEATAKMSSEIAGLLSWEKSDLEAMITNAPKAVVSFKEYAEGILRQPSSTEKRIKQIKTFIQEVRNRYVFDNTPESEQNEYFFDTKIIPQQFESTHLALLNEVVSFFDSKYQVNGKIITDFNQDDFGKKLNFVEESATEGFRKNYAKLMKNDVQYVFSYIAILQVKDLLAQFTEDQFNKMRRNRKQKSEGERDEEGVVQFEQMAYSEFNSFIMKYLYKLLDLHEESRHKIIFPQTKVIEFMNKIRMLNNLSQLESVDESIASKISFESLMLLIAKDRKMIRDHHLNVQPLLGYEPELALNELYLEQKRANTAEAQPIHLKDRDEMEDEVEGFANYEKTAELATNESIRLKQPKQLPSGFLHYLRRFEAILQKVAGSTMFLPKTLYDPESKKLYGELKELIKVDLSNEEWLREKVRLVVADLFEFRYQIEKNMSSSQLQAFDSHFGQFFTPEMIGIVIRYQNFREESIAKHYIYDNYELSGTNDDINNQYLDVMKDVKNPRALKMFNNLITTKNITGERYFENIKAEKEVTHGLKPTPEERNNIDYQLKRELNSVTIARLGRDAFSLADEDDQPTERRQNEIRHALGEEKQVEKNSQYIEELKILHSYLDNSDTLKAELDNRIRRIEAYEAFEKEEKERARKKPR